MDPIAKIKALLVERGMKYSDLDSKLGVRGYTSKLMTGARGREISALSLAKIAQAFEVNVSYFFDETETPTASPAIRDSGRRVSRGWREFRAIAATLPEIDASELRAIEAICDVSEEHPHEFWVQRLQEVRRRRDALRAAITPAFATDTLQGS